MRKAALLIGLLIGTSIVLDFWLAPSGGIVWAHIATIALAIYILSKHLPLAIKHNCHPVHLINVFYAGAFLWASTIMVSAGVLTRHCLECATWLPSGHFQLAAAWAGFVAAGAYHVAFLRGWLPKNGRLE